MKQADREWWLAGGSNKVLNVAVGRTPVGQILTGPGGSWADYRLAASGWNWAITAGALATRS